jgi:23S rRNA (adenine1618-N6)-methyltransferase
MKSAQMKSIKNGHLATDPSTALDKKTNAKAEMHHRNVHNHGYDFVKLAQVHAPLRIFLSANPAGKLTIDFSQPSAVKALNAGLLKQFYQVQHWDIPAGFLCPAVPGRADYIHYIADLLGQDKDGQIPQGKQIRGLDIGTGANLIYPIVASQSYGWNMIGSDINQASYSAASLIVESNPNLRKLVSVRLQKQPKAIFSGVVKDNELFDFSLCNPPFHISADAALAGSQKESKFGETQSKAKR